MRIRLGICVVSILALASCSDNHAPPADRDEAPAAQTLPSVPLASPAAIEAPIAGAAVDAPKAADAAQAGQLSAARSYLQQAQASAEERHRLAVLACGAPGQEDRDACRAAADDGLEAEVRAARAEFEAQMRQPN